MRIKRSIGVNPLLHTFKTSSRRLELDTPSTFRETTLMPSCELEE